MLRLTKLSVSIAFVIVVLIATGLIAQEVRPVNRGTAIWSVYFSPNGDALQAIIGTLAQAKTSICVQSYYFTASPLAKALVDAHKRGVKVEVILDKSQRTAKYSSADFFAHAGIPTYIDTEHPIAHDKIMVVDNRSVITGSYNFTRAAEERNVENLLILESTDLAARYQEHWRIHREHSTAYRGR